MRIRHVVVVAGLALGSMSGTANASFLYKFSEIGSDVVLTGSGEFNTDILSYSGPRSFAPAAINPSNSYAQVGPGDEAAELYRIANISGPNSYGFGGFRSADSFSGDFAYFQAGTQYKPAISVTSSYISGTALFGTATFSGETFADLGLTPGTYTYTYSGQLPELALFARVAFVPPTITDTVTIQVGTVPLPSSAPMFGAALIGLAGLGYAAKRKKAAAA